MATPETMEWTGDTIFRLVARAIADESFRKAFLEGQGDACEVADLSDEDHLRLRHLQDREVLSTVATRMYERYNEVSCPSDF